MEPEGIQGRLLMEAEVHRERSKVRIEKHLLATYFPEGSQNLGTAQSPLQNPWGLVSGSL